MIANGPDLPLGIVLSPYVLRLYPNCPKGHMELAQRLRRITRKLADIERMPGQVEAFEKFGEPDHRFQLGPALESERVAEFERRHNIALPADYRAFITQVGHSGPGREGRGAGPPSGLLPLAWAGADGADRDDAKSLTKPFPHAPGRYVQEVRYESLDGTIVVGDQGCAIMSLLVVSGAGRGRIVYAGEGYSSYTTDRDFLAWYERWLDETAAGIEFADGYGGWFGFIGPDEAALLEDAEWLVGNLRQEPSPYRRAMAALALGNHIATPGVRAVLHTAVGDADACVRTAALAVLGEHPVQEDKPVVRAALADPSPQVRMAASWAVPDA